MINEDIKFLHGIFADNGYEIRIIGGAVRDYLLGLEPHDIDLATTATPEQMVYVAKCYDVRILETGLSHGTVGFVINNTVYEVTTLRIDKETDGRHATVEFTQDWELDASRRDFTFNAMSMDIDGKIYDYFGGQEDLKQGLVRFVGDPEARINEDYLRILRYYRFSNRIAKSVNFDNPFGIDTAIMNTVSGLKSISGERIWMEMSRILSHNGNLYKILSDMRLMGVLENIGLLIPNDSYFHVANDIAKRTNNPILVLSGLINNETSYESIVERWKLSNAEKKLLRFICTTRTQNSKGLKRIVLIYGRDYAIYLATVKSPEYVRMMTNWEIPIFPIGGKDLIELGYPVGPTMGKQLSILKEQWICSDYKLTKDELLKGL